ncbi:uncharacterized protein YcnI [Sinorhizobium fredii]
MLKKLSMAAALVALGAGAAIAHTTLEAQEAPVGASHKAVFRVPHGCDGKPTNVVRVQIPEGVIAVKPMPKSGWSLEKVTGAYAKAYDYHGTPTKEGVKEVLWKGGNLADDEYDEFVVRVYLTPDCRWARCSISRSCRNARRERSNGGSRFRPKPRAATTSNFRLPG